MSCGMTATSPRRRILLVPLLAIAASSVEAVGAPMPQTAESHTVVTTSHHILEAICR